MFLNTSNDNPNLILLCGLPRSGTTWLGKLFDSSPHTLYRHEPDSVERLSWLPLYVEEEVEGGKEKILEYVQNIPYISDSKVSASMPVFKKSYMGPGKQMLVDQTLRIIKVCSKLGLESQVPGFCTPSDPSHFRLVWKSIESSGRLGFLSEHLERKRIIFILRHPCAITNSVARGGLKQFNNYDVVEDWEVFQALLDTREGKKWGVSFEQIKEMKPLERIGWKYLVTMEKAIEDLKGKKDCKLVVYEELCENSLPIIQDLFEFCNMTFEEQSSSFLKQSTSRTDSRYYSLTKLPLDAAYKWKKQLDPSDQKLLLKLLERSPLARFWSS